MYIGWQVTSVLLVHESFVAALLVHNFILFFFSFILLLPFSVFLLFFIEGELKSVTSLDS